MNHLLSDWWDKQIQRADGLAALPGGSQELLVFYSQLLRSQKQIYEFLRGRKDWLPSGDPLDDFEVIHESIPAFLDTIARHAPLPLAEEARELTKSSGDSLAAMIDEYLNKPSDILFFAKGILQPYFHWLVQTRAGSRVIAGDRSCPHCNGKPQVSLLQDKEPNAGSGNRELICSRCLSSWEFRRVVCANCGEEQPGKLGYFHSPEFDHVRIEACDTCRHYIKGVDLTRFGFAAPLVDEIYAAPLDLWAREHGYQKIELNLVGL